MWTPWGQCSVSCGPGLQSRYRFCSSPQRYGGGLPCLGPHREDQVCLSAPCDRESEAELVLMDRCTSPGSSSHQGVDVGVRSLM